MFDSFLNDIKKQHQFILQTIADYNIKIKSGKYIVHSNELDVKVYYNFIASQIINILVNDESLFLSNDISMVLNFDQINIIEKFDWELQKEYRKIKTKNANEVVTNLINICFDKKCVQFIQEICAQDIVCSGKFIKEFSSLFSGIRGLIIMSCKGEEGLVEILAKMRSGEYRGRTQIEERFSWEYRKCGALIRNRVFKQNAGYKTISENVRLLQKSDELLDYRYEKNVCQFALLHISVRETNSCGTGFIISEDGYALTCAHVVEGAKEIDATIINGDGYSSGDDEGLEVYDGGYGEVIYINKELDIALLKLEHFGIGFLPLEQKSILPELGDEVVVFGYPLGYEMPQSNFFGPNISFYKGYVSSNQVVNGNSVTFLDIDAKSGNSGSPVISTKTGKVIGIISGVKLGGKLILNEKMPYMIPIQHFVKLLKNNEI